MAWQELGRQAEAENNEDRGRKIGVYIGVLAVLLAIGSLGGTNSQQDATIKTIEASNVWAFFQAKNLRREVIRAEVDLLELGVAANPNISDATRAATAEKVKALKARDAVMTTDPKSGEGLDELFAKAKSIEAERDIALKRNPYFDFGTAFLSIAIALASVALLTNGMAM
ncbi:MAG: DUF4337 domain-containing protein, partial [Hyphomicrobiaceae bacterium]|nr:DUF4337 domain-containing protein [Hyphomicrobiaceae bacterium]